MKAYKIEVTFKMLEKDFIEKFESIEGCHEEFSKEFTEGNGVHDVVLDIHPIKLGEKDEENK